MEIRISVRNLVEFILRHGDIDNRHQASPDNAMQEGSRIHRMIQKRMGAEYEAEVSFRYTMQTEEYQLTVEGRADGIIHHEGQVIVDEIKGTYRDLSRMNSPRLLHIAQAKCYAYMCCLKEDLKEIRIRLTYCNMESEELRYFYEDYTFQELKEWFDGLIAAYGIWAEDACRWQKKRQASIEGLPFPFPYREGQKELAANVYRTIYHKKKLFLEAPTGVGKTITTLYPAIQAMGKGMGEKLFYLTAKTITRTVAEDTLGLLRERGLCFRSVTLTAKEKICFTGKADCNPESCPYAKGHYDRINDAVYDLLTSGDNFGREQVEYYAEKHQVCPFEMCLDMSLFADGVICDYNYVFDPHVYLRRFFADGVQSNYLFLIDEAHNLLERGREMYSAVLWKEDFRDLAKELKLTMLSELSAKDKSADISGQMTFELTQNMTLMSENGEEVDQTGTAYFTSGRKTKAGEENPVKNRKKSILVREGYAEKMIFHLGRCDKQFLALKREGGQCCIVEKLDELMQPLLRLHGTMEDYLSETEEERLPVREMLLDLYFDIGHFLEMYELVDENYVKYTQLTEEDTFFVKLFCVNPAENLRRCMDRGRSSILFSATFLPIQYYKRLLGGQKEDYEVYAHSVFSPKKRALLVAEDVTSKYTRRSEEEYFRIAEYIDEVVKNRHGNYMVFCPSYAFMHQVYAIYEKYFADEEKECLIQQESMNEAEREEFLARFRGNEALDFRAEIAMEIEEEDSILIGFCVLGGIFSEGIDLKNDGLIGAVIIGTGLPLVCYEREILKNYFNENGENGFDYAYRYPGMNKVLQAAGRVIRTAEDVGVIALLDERFLQPAYQKMFPREWEEFEIVTLESVGHRVERFWDEWL